MKNNFKKTSMKIKGLVELNSNELKMINGGASFAYRVGQGLRFAFLSGGGVFTVNAFLDLVATETA